MVATSLLWFREEANSSLSDTIKIGAFADSRVSKVTEPDLMMPEAPFSRLLRSSLAAHQQQSPPQPQVASEVAESWNKQHEHESVAADDNGNTASAIPSLRNDKEDILSQDLKAPFAGYNGNKEELGAFFNEFRTAPPLQGDDSEATAADHLGDLTTQLEQFELDLQQYDQVITRLCQRDNNN